MIINEINAQWNVPTDPDTLTQRRSVHAGRDPRMNDSTVGELPRGAVRQRVKRLQTWNHQAYILRRSA
jgi:hypothetical protein